jgi:hypothetical protein
MKKTLINLYLQKVYRFNDKYLTHYPESRFKTNKEIEETGGYHVPLVPLKKLFLTNKLDILDIKKISSNQIAVTLTGLLGKLFFIRKFNSSELIDFEKGYATYCDGFFPVYFEESRLIFNLLRGKPGLDPINNYLFLTSRSELASLYGEILKKQNWLTSGFFHEFIIRGIGYRYRYHKSNKINSLFFKIGYGHKILFSLSSMKNEITFRNNRRYDFVLSSVNKGALKQFAEQIRTIKPTDAYKGKGIKYYHTPLKLKVGKVR